MPILFPFTLEAKQSHPEILSFPLRVEKYSPPRFFSLYKVELENPGFPMSGERVEPEMRDAQE